MTIEISEEYMKKHQSDLSPYMKSYMKGWIDCKKLVLEILKRDWTGLDMSINNCDEYYIKQIEEL